MKRSEKSTVLWKVLQAFFWCELWLGLEFIVGWPIYISYLTHDVSFRGRRAGRRG